MALGTRRKSLIGSCLQSCLEFLPWRGVPKPKGPVLDRKRVPAHPRFRLATSYAPLASGRLPPPWHPYSLLYLYVSSPYPHRNPTLDNIVIYGGVTVGIRRDYGQAPYVIELMLVTSKPPACFRPANPPAWRGACRPGPVRQARGSPGHSQAGGLRYYLVKERLRKRSLVVGVIQ
jgi:hypothetical protein